MRRFPFVFLLFLLPAAYVNAAEHLDSTFHIVTPDSIVRIEPIAVLPMPDGVRRDDVMTVTAYETGGACTAAQCVELNLYTRGGVQVWSQMRNTAMSKVVAAAVDSLGRIVIVGETPDDGSNHGSEFGIMRFTADGKLDNRFGPACRASTCPDLVRIGFGLGEFYGDRPTAAAIDAKDRIVVVGSVVREATNDFDFGAVRLDNNGLIDGTFGKNGKLTIAFDLGAECRYEIPYSVAIGVNGKIVIGGIANDSARGGTDNPCAGFQPVLVQLTTSGSFDTTFCNPTCNDIVYPAINSGRRVFNFDGSFPLSAYFYAVDVADNGDIVAAGSIHTPPGIPSVITAAIARFSPSGDWMSQNKEAGTEDYARYTTVRFADSTGTRIIAAGMGRLRFNGALLQPYFMVQAFNRRLEFDAGYGTCLTDNSALCFSSAGSTFTDYGDYGYSTAKNLNLDGAGRPLFAGRFYSVPNTNASRGLFQRISNDFGPMP